MEFSNKKYSTICILDTETTSVYWNSAAPVQIAAVLVDDKGEVIDTFNERIKTTHSIDPDASKVHGIYAKDLIHCRSERAVLGDFFVWLTLSGAEAILTYNGNTFDIPMLKCRVEHLQIPFDSWPELLDAKEDVMAAKKAKLFKLDQLGRKWKLTLVAERLGFSIENAHDALADVLMLKNVWFTLDPVIYPNNWKKPSLN